MILSISSLISVLIFMWISVQFNNVIVSVISFFILFPLLNIILKDVYLHYIFIKEKKKLFSFKKRAKQ